MYRSPITAGLRKNLRPALDRPRLEIRSPVGVIATALLACVIGYLAFWMFN